MDLQSLCDERDIVRGLSRFARILDTKSWDKLHDVFAEDIQFDYGTAGEQQGIDALRANMTRFLDRCGNTQHLIGSILVDIDGDNAISRAYVQARHQGVAAAKGDIFDTNGEYVDLWQRGPQGWRIVRRDALWTTFAGDPAVIAAGRGDLASDLQ